MALATIINSNLKRESEISNRCDLVKDKNALVYVDRRKSRNERVNKGLRSELILKKLHVLNSISPKVFKVNPTNDKCVRFTLDELSYNQEEVQNVNFKEGLSIMLIIGALFSWTIIGLYYLITFLF